MSSPSVPSAPATPAASSPAKPAASAQPNQPAAQSGKTAANPGQNPGAKPAEQPRMVKVKMDGKEMDVPESEVIAAYQEGKVASQRFQEASRLRKEAEAILKAADENPADFFTKRGKDARKWAEEFLLDQLKREAESPEQKKARENEEKLRKYEADEKRQAEESKQKDQERLTSEQREKYDKLFTEALTQSGLPRTPFTVKRMAELQLINIKKKLELSAPQLAKLVREDYINEQKSLMGALDGDQLVEFLGADLVKKLSKAQIAKLKGRTPNGSGSGSNPRSGSSQKTEMSWRDYQKRNRGRPA